MMNRFEVRFPINKSKKVVGQCKGYKIWRIYDSWNTKKTAFVIKTYQEEHDCGRVKKNRVATAS